MAKNSKTENTRSNPVDIHGDDALGVISAFQGLYHAFGARFEGWTADEDGLHINGFTVDGQYEPETLIRDVNVKNRRVQLNPAITWLSGVEPAPFANAQEMSQWSVQNFRGSVEEGSTRTPKYARDAFSTLKASMGISGKRGPKRTTISLKNLANLDASTFKNAKVDPADLQKLIEIAQSVIDETPATEAVTA